MNDEQAPRRTAVTPAGTAPPPKKPWREPRLVLEGRLEDLTGQTNTHGPPSAFGPFGASSAGGTGGLNCT